MLNSLPAPLLGVLAFALLLLNILFWVPILLVFALVKLVLPFQRVRLALDPVLIDIAENWIACIKRSLVGSSIRTPVRT